VGAGDLTEFRRAGTTLLSLRMVNGSEGNLSIWDGHRLLITRTGSELGALGEDDVLEGTLEEPPPGASSDLALHVDRYRRQGPGAIAHAHPSGTVPEGWREGQPHGLYAHAPSLSAAVSELVRQARAAR